MRTPSIVLLGNLAMTEFGFGILAQPIFVAHKFGAIYGNVKLHCVASLTSKTLASDLGALSLATLTAVSTDRLLALVLSVRYRVV